MFDIITSILASLGGLGVFLLMLAENVFPPIPSEVILPLAGYTAAQGRGSLWVVAIAGTLGSAAGAVLWYYVGRWIGIDRLKRFASRHGRWLTLTPGEVDHVDRWFDRYGRWAVLFGRMVPGVNRRPKRTPYRRAKGTPFVEQRNGYDGRTVRAGCGVGRA